MTFFNPKITLKQGILTLKTPVYRPPKTLIFDRDEGYFGLKKDIQRYLRGVDEGIYEVDGGIFVLDEGVFVYMQVLLLVLLGGRQMYGWG